MLFWIIAGIVGLGLYFLSQNKSVKRDKTTITHKRVIQTNDGEVHISQTQVIDSVRTTYTKQDLSKQIIKDVAPSITHTQPQQITSEASREPLIISPNQLNKFSHQEQKTSPVREFNPTEEFILVSPKTDNQQDLFDEKQEGKDCPNCKRSLPFASFRASSKHEDGLTKWCGDCLSIPRTQQSNKKQCPNCKKNRLKTSFYKNSKQPDGLTKWCKTCMDKSKR